MGPGGCSDSDPPDLGALWAFALTPEALLAILGLYTNDNAEWQGHEGHFDCDANAAKRLDFSIEIAAVRTSED